MDFQHHNPRLNPFTQAKVETITRRHFLGKSCRSFGAAALSGLLADSMFGSLGAKQAQGSAFDSLQRAGGQEGILDQLHFAPKAKRIIYIHMAGSPSPHDLLDFKPLLNAQDGKDAPDSILPERSAFLSLNPNKPKILGSPYQFEQVGSNGAWVSELLPHFKEIVDDVCIIRSMYTDQFNHAPAQLLLHTGFAPLGRPSMGSWLSYGLGSENSDLPAFLVLVSGGKAPSAGQSAWGSGFLPSVHQGVQCRSEGDPVLFLSNPEGMDRAARARGLKLLEDMNRLQHDEFGDPETLTRISQYEMAFKMQVSVPETMDISQEPQEVLDLYGADPNQASFANNCLLARKLAEQGVRYVQLFDWGWDTHGTSKNDDLLSQLPKKCRETDRPVAALIKDLKRRGLLEDTLVVWSGEFGRTAVNEGREGSTFLGRDYHADSFTIFMAGGGSKPGMVYGKTDDFGVKIIEKPVHIYDLQATILAMMGIDHNKLTYRTQGGDIMLTNFKGGIVHDLIA